MKALLSSMFQPSESKTPAISPSLPYALYHQLDAVGYSRKKGRLCHDHQRSLQLLHRLQGLQFICCNSGHRAGSKCQGKTQVLLLYVLFFIPSLVARELQGFGTYDRQNLKSMSLSNLHPIDKKAVRGRTTLCTHVSRFSVP